MSDKFKVAVFSSGSGSNFEAIVKAGIPNVEVSFLFCNVEDAYVLERAKNLSIDSICLSHKSFESRKGFEEDDLVCDSCKDAHATSRASHDEVCTDCFYEIYDGCP